MSKRSRREAIRAFTDEQRGLKPAAREIAACLRREERARREREAQLAAAFERFFATSGIDATLH
jgi:hypothetical protein